MATSKEIGVVVVGIGMAGGVRVRDLKEKLCDLTLRGVVSRHQVNLPDVTGMSLDEALAREDVDCIIVSTENKLHEEYVQRSLESGKHVLVDYPMALSASKAKQLFDLAKQKDLVLWEENIALLTDSHKLIKAKAQSTELKSATYSIAGSYNGWIEKFNESGPPFVSGITSLQCMLDCFGPLSVLSGKLETQEDGYTATACLQTKDSQSPISISLGRKKTDGPKFRNKSAVYEFVDGEVIDLDKLPPKPPSKPGLFMQDLINFCRAVHDGKSDPEARQRSIQSYEIAEQIHALF